MAKRGESGLSLVIGVDKPEGFSSHDVVNRCRTVFHEKRVGHAGTLDPLASGVLLVCIGPATRLDKYLAGHDKSYRARITFGVSTDTDDRAGEMVDSAEVPEKFKDESFAEEVVAGLVGTHEQVPPAYSAIKVDGVKAYDAARKGKQVDLEPRTVEVYDARLVYVDEGHGGLVNWMVDMTVSKGTYVRALARDLGASLGCPAHLGGLRRFKLGNVNIHDCQTIESLELAGAEAALDPVRLLGYRFAFADDMSSDVENGKALTPDAFEMCEALGQSNEALYDSCTSNVHASEQPLDDGELVSVIVGNKLKAIYAYDSKSNLLKPDCVFSLGVYRG